MKGQIGQRGKRRQELFTTAKAMVIASVVAGCSSMNPANWFEDQPQPELATPKGDAPDAPRKEPAKGLVAAESERYAAPVRREASPTKPLVKRTASEESPQASAVPAAPRVETKPLDNVNPAETKTAEATSENRPVPAHAEVTQTPLPPPQQAQPSPTPAQPVQTASAEQTVPEVAAQSRLAAAPQPTARDDGPAAPPASMDMIAPPAANVPETVPSPRRGGARTLNDQFQRRLTESSSTSVSSTPVAMPAPAAGPASSLNDTALAMDETPIHLIPPRASKSHGGKGMAAPVPEPAASFQVASVDFRNGSSVLTSADRAALTEVARLYKTTRGSVVRIVGFAPDAAASLGGDSVTQVMGGLDTSMKRANAVAKELTRLGIPARKILVGSDGSAAPVGAAVYLDVM